MPLDVITGLQALGHQVNIMPKDSMDFGSAQGIAILHEKDKLVYIGGSDHRRDGMVAGY
jgi:gamma-glutamyltranspeptidase/glutathione hydrolase